MIRFDFQDLSSFFDLEFALAFGCIYSSFFHFLTFLDINFISCLEQASLLLILGNYSDISGLVGFIE